MRTISSGVLLLLVAACGETANSGSSESDYTSLQAATLEAIEDPTSFTLTGDAVYATVPGGIVRTDLDGKNATQLAGSWGARSLLAVEGARLVFFYGSSSTGSVPIAELPITGAGKSTIIATTAKAPVAATWAGQKLFYTWGWYNTEAGVAVLNPGGSSDEPLGGLGGPQGYERPVVVGETVFVADGRSWQGNDADSTIVAFKPSSDGTWTKKSVALIPETGGGALARGGSLRAHADSLYLVGSRGLHRAAMTDQVPVAFSGAKPYAPVVVPTATCAANRTFSVDDDGIYLACKQPDGSHELRSFARDGSPKKALGPIRRDDGVFTGKIVDMKTSPGHVYVLADERLARYAK